MSEKRRSSEKYYLKRSIADKGLELYEKKSLPLLINYFTNILVVSSVYFLSNFSSSRSSHLQALCQKVIKNFQSSKENTCARVVGSFRNRLLHRSFSLNFWKFLIAGMFCRTSTKICL